MRLIGSIGVLLLNPIEAAEEQEPTLIEQNRWRAALEQEYRVARFGECLLTDSTLPLDGAIVGFLLRVVDRFEGMVSDPDALLANLKAIGLDDAAVTQLQTFVNARASDVSKLSTDLPKLLEVLESSNPERFRRCGRRWTVSGLN